MPENNLLKGEAMITNIRVDKISPHPDNPRKDLGDLTELAASITYNGILQNLTVVPHFDIDQGAPFYRVVIGHRRLAAAKLAGLTEVPCAISDMDPKTQVATMLLENMQRSDLTVWEQAQGFQMMLNFGETVEDVAGLTGFSETTIRRRVKLLDLDPVKFKKSVARGATLQDYAELDKISSVEQKNKVLEKIGTADFQWALKSAIDTEKREKTQAALIAEFEKFAVRVDKGDGLRTVDWFSCDNPKKVTKPADAGEKKYYFMVNGPNYIQLLTEADGRPQGPTHTGPSAEEIRRQERRTQLDQLNNRAGELRQTFVREYVGKQAHHRDLMGLALWTMIAGDTGYYGQNKAIRDMLSIELPEDEEIEDFDEDEFTARAVSEAFEAAPERVLLVATYCLLDDARASFHNWRGEYEGNADLVALYSCLERLGYEISAEERQLMDGTHELYVREETAR